MTDSMQDNVTDTKDPTGPDQTSTTTPSEVRPTPPPPEVPTVRNSTPGRRPLFRS